MIYRALLALKDLTLGPTQALLAIAALVALPLSATTASAVPVGTGLSGPNTAETSWFVTSDAIGDPESLGVVNPYTTAWVNPSTAGLDANWISPRFSGPTAINDTYAASTDVIYTYSSLEFDRPTSILHIGWASDNDAEFFLNGASLAVTGNEDFGSLMLFTIFADNNAYSDTDNVFSVVVRNIAQASGNPTGLLVNISTPLPPALLLFGSGLAGLGWLSSRRGRRRAQQPANTAS